MILRAKKKKRMKRPTMLKRSKKMAPWSSILSRTVKRLNRSPLKLPPD